MALNKKHTIALLSLVTSLSACASSFEEESASEAQQAIVGGTQATEGEFPWQARLTITMGGGNYLCGGTLIANNWVLTAAHCVTDDNGAPATSVSVVLGDHNSAITESSEQTRTAARFVAHPDYNPVTVANDIALVQLSSPVTLNSRVATIPLASQTYAVGTTTTASGWGVIDMSPVSFNPDGSVSIQVTGTSILNKVSTPLVNNTACQSVFGSAVTDSMLCAGIPSAQWYKSGTGTCSGDSGGPLVVKNSSGVSTLVGITSFGSGVCSSYSVFTRVSSFTSWIAAVQAAAARSGMTWGKFTADDTYLDALSTRGVDRLGCWGQPRINGSACNAYSGDTACTESRPILCVNVDNSARPAYKPFGDDYYSGWVNGVFALTAPVSGLLLTSRATADKLCAKALGTGYRMVEHHDGKYISGMSETAYYGSAWTAAASSQTSGGWNGFGHGNVSAASRFWVAINDQTANCWGN